MKIYKIIRIDEPDFGCEGRPDGQPAMDKVRLVDERGQELIIEVPDALLYQFELDEGDTASYSDERGLEKITPHTTEDQPQ